MLTFVSLFSGIGGSDIAAKRLGMRVLWHCEREPYPRSVLAARWPGVPCYPDVRDLCPDGGRGMADTYGVRCEKSGSESGSSGTIQCDPGIEPAGVCDADPTPIDILWASPPCQDLSVAGKRAGLSGSRSGLFFDVVRVVQALRPRFVCVENVPGLLTSSDGRDFGTVIAELAGCGYRLEWSVLGAWEVGATHRRDRLWIIGVRGDLADVYGDGAGRGSSPESCSDRTDDGIPREDGCSLADPYRPRLQERGVAGTGGGTGGGTDATSVRGGSQPLPWPPGPADREAWARVLDVRPDLAPAVAGAGGKRRLGVGFVTWLMGFPDGWCDVPGMTRVKALKALGNAVVPACAVVVLSRVLELDAMIGGAE